MANIPHSSRYRTTGNKASANTGAAAHARAAQHGNNAQNWSADQSSGMNWLWVIVGLGLLIAFPAPMLGLIGLALLAHWLFGKK